MVSKRIKIGLVVTALLLLENVSAQNRIYATLPFLNPDSAVFKRGFYKDYNEFKYNRPSVTTQYNINAVEKKRTYQGYYKHTQYTVEFADENEAKNIDLKAVWGFCDGSNIYIKGESGLTKEICFEKIQVLGKYCIFMGWSFLSESNPSYIVYNTHNGLTTTSGGGLSNGIGRKVIDLETGTIDDFNKNKLIELISSDSELLARFESEKKKNEKLIEYIIEFNKRYKTKFSR